MPKLISPLMSALSTRLSREWSNDRLRIGNLQRFLSIKALEKHLKGDLHQSMSCPPLKDIFWRLHKDLSTPRGSRNSYQSPQVDVCARKDVTCDPIMFGFGPNANGVAAFVTALFVILEVLFIIPLGSMLKCHYLTGFKC